MCLCACDCLCARACVFVCAYAGHALIEESSITGESIPKEKFEGHDVSIFCI